MSWIYLFIGGLFEAAWAISMKYTHGMTRFWPSLVTFVLMIASFAFLALAIRRMPVGTGYAVWTGIGVAGTALLGILLFSEPVNFLRILCLLLIFLGIFGLKMTSPY
jgi:quaternary ammonium compound-resistance protein SugE